MGAGGGEGEEREGLGITLVLGGLAWRGGSGGVWLRAEHAVLF